MYHIPALLPYFGELYFSHSFKTDRGTTSVVFNQVDMVVYAYCAYCVCKVKISA